jgi:uracil-DNA glycosylase
MEASEKPLWTDAALAWNQTLDAYFTGSEYQKISKHIELNEENGCSVYPPSTMRFRALELTPLQSVRCVILGQDPYHQRGQANGLAFSVNTGVNWPPSLRNLLKELQSDVQLSVPLAIQNKGDLSVWARQGVLLLNTLLSVREGEPLSHQNLGWEPLIMQVISSINEHRKGVVFVLWGKSARAYKSLISKDRHHIIEGVHPSPLSAHRGFFGSKPFSRVNEYLLQQGDQPINW